MNVPGIVLPLAYRLSRHFWLGWTLARWFGLLILALGVWALIYCWPAPWPPVAAVTLLIVYVGTLAWARRTGYVRYARLPDGEQQLEEQKTPPPLRKEELVPARVSGWFTVEGRNQYYVDVEADFETVGTREHIVLGRIHPSRFLVLGNWPEYELGWWYVFFRPEMIRKVDVGQLISSPRPQRALRVVYTPDNETEQMVYLTTNDSTSLRRIWDDLLRDAPQEGS
ncbi:MAG: hypothetical protein ACP5JJ_02935 [Anaerolineae bacterium]